MSAPVTHTGRQAPPLHVRTRWRGSAATLTLTGELDYATAPLLSAQLTSVLARQPQRLVLDLAALTFIDCAGLTPIIRIRNHLPPATPLILRSPTARARTLLAIAGADQLPGLHCT